MNWLFDLLSKNRRSISFFIIALLIVMLIAVQSLIVPYVNQFILAVFHSPFAILKHSYLELKSVSHENRELREKLVEASIEISQFEEVRRENDRLRSVLGFEPPPGYRLIPAEVLSISGSPVPVSAVIDKGSVDSIYVDEPVVNQQGLIGRVSAVSRGFATVQLLTDPSNRVAARLAVSREMGIIKYMAPDGMILDNFPIQGQISNGDTVLSSGLGGIYPPGLNVGTVSELELPENEPFAYVVVKPAVNFYSLEELFILKVMEP